jgi:hypothetical protein
VITVWGRKAASRRRLATVRDDIAMMYDELGINGPLEKVTINQFYFNYYSD